MLPASDAMLTAKWTRAFERATGPARHQRRHCLAHPFRQVGTPGTTADLCDHPRRVVSGPPGSHERGRACLTPSCPAAGGGRFRSPSLRRPVCARLRSRCVGDASARAQGPSAILRRDDRRGRDRQRPAFVYREPVGFRGHRRPHGDRRPVTLPVSPARTCVQPCKDRRQGRKFPEAVDPNRLVVSICRRYRRR